MSFKLEGGQHKIKDQYKNIPEDVIHDIWICAIALLEKGDVVDKITGEGLIKKYYLKPNGEEY